MSVTYRNLKTPINRDSGVADDVLIAVEDDFEEGGIKCPEAPFTNPGDETVIRTAHVFKSGRAFAKISLAPEKNELTAKTIGDKGSQKLAQELKVFVPGSYAELHEAFGRYLNSKLIVLSKDANCSANMWYQLGCDCVFAYLTVDFATGTTVSGAKGYLGTITYNAGYIQTYDVTDGPVILGD